MVALSKYWGGHSDLLAGATVANAKWRAIPPPPHTPRTTSRSSRRPGPATQTCPALLARSVRAATPAKGADSARGGGETTTESAPHFARGSEGPGETRKGPGKDSERAFLRTDQA